MRNVIAHPSFIVIEFRAERHRSAAGGMKVKSGFHAFPGQGLEMMSFVALVLAGSIGAAPATRATISSSLKPPGTLSVVAATKSQVQLAWGAGDPAATGYVVERKGAAGWPTPEQLDKIDAVTSTTYDDKSIAQYGTYFGSHRFRVIPLSCGNPPTFHQVGP